MTVRRSSGDLEQGMGLSTDDGWFTVAGHKSKMGALWTATAPERVDVLLRPLRARSEMRVRLWNVWKLATWGSTMSGVGNVGMLVESTGPHAATLRCSAGPGPVRFDDLVVELDFVPEGAQVPPPTSFRSGRARLTRPATRRGRGIVRGPRHRPRALVLSRRRH